MKNNEYQIAGIKKIKGLFKKLSIPYRIACAKQTAIGYYVPYESSLPWEHHVYRSFKYTHKLQSGHRIKISEYFVAKDTLKQTLVVKITRK